MKRIPQFAALFLLFLFLSACGAQESGGPVSASATQGDFKITFTSAQSVYDADSLDPEAPLDLEVRVDYLGREEEVDISHGAFIGNVYLYNAEDTVPTFPTEGYATYSTLRSGQPTIETHTGAMEYEHMGGLPAGKYTAEAYVSFHVLPCDWSDWLSSGASFSDCEKIEASFELSFEIRD